VVQGGMALGLGHGDGRRGEVEASGATARAAMELRRATDSGPDLG
jgi:hypothetical protein